MLTSSSFPFVSDLALVIDLNIKASVSRVSCKDIRINSAERMLQE